MCGQKDSRSNIIQGNTSKSGLKCIRSIINKKNELNVMVYDIKSHTIIIGITESCANNYTTDAELAPIVIHLCLQIIK